jgi:hypothetical protein
MLCLYKKKITGTKLNANYGQVKLNVKLL